MVENLRPVLLGDCGHYQGPDTPGRVSDELLAFCGAMADDLRRQVAAMVKADGTAFGDPDQEEMP